MDAIESEIVEQEGQRFRITIYPDSDTPNPLEDWDEMGRILSLNRRHQNFDPDGIAAALESDPDAVPLSYYEHGLCRWSVAGELPAGCQCPWDSVAFAGLWLPDEATREAARNHDGRARRSFMRKRARQACDVYSSWCNGEVYGFGLARLSLCECCGEEQAEPLDSCWGFYGLETCRVEARAACALAPSPV